ncbi:hypothetical protein [Desulfovibrio sp.]|uniref:hypothetical protein n=1 Tax=Desulfovibrio sp. TaxID=885 RepID=UPI002A910B1F|nr:hypothetical protein [Desulfovibrio sp.]MDY5430952.1 hypothetical protein [Desulfovibrio sp.]
MHRIDTSTATPDHKFTEGDPAVPVAATTVSAEWLNAVQEELVAVITGGGLELQKSDNGQLFRAIGKLIGDKVPIATNDTPGLVKGSDAVSIGEDGSILLAGAVDGVRFNESGGISRYGVCDSAQAAQAKTVTIPGFRLVPGALAYVRFTHGNTHAAPTLDVSGTGAKPLTIDGTNPIPGYGVNAVASFMYDGARYVVVSGFAVDDNRAGGQTYLKFPNGSQIIWGDWGEFVSGQTVTFVQPFQAMPSLIGYDNESTPGNTERKAKFSAITETYFTVNDWAYGSPSKTGCWVAFGRWR